MELSRVYELTAGLWSWLAEHPLAEKDKWPGWADHPKQKNDCFCCTYVEEHYGELGPKACCHCPLRELFVDYCMLWYKRQDGRLVSEARQEVADFARERINVC